MRPIAKWILDALFPPYCASCRREGVFLCKKCIRFLKKKKIRRNIPVWAKKREFKNLDGVIYALSYRDNPIIKSALEQFKYHFTQELAVHFAELLAEKLGELGMVQKRSICLIPIPLHRRRFLERGFNQADVICRETQKLLGYKKVRIIPFLIRTKNTEQQARLRRDERKKNLIGAFEMNKKCVHLLSWNNQWAKSICFLVDDVCTTGSTLENAAKTLKQAGLKKVYGLVVARALK